MHPVHKLQQPKLAAFMVVMMVRMRHVRDCKQGAKLEGPVIQ